ncbi:atrial natriuretic peptide receptor 3-like [Physella acuta]|uniref:atrial natriuretic peptide receptor 3-like n=1 Tax=Physella acuta TaxID=109671 RepID=UPI0027DD305D|nr:atrial natriuretic peptide receptor 3-like [Physella acuta]
MILLGMNFVFNHYINKTLDVVLGPICDYVLAPVVRQVFFWNVSVLSIGGGAKDFVFQKKTHFQMLTKVGPVQPTYFNNFFNSMAQKYGWGKLVMAYYRNGQNYIHTDLCHFVAESIYFARDKKHSVAVVKLEDNTIDDTLIKQMGLDTAG